MYDINAGNARPEMAEVGKGSNQLADYRPVERAIEANAAMQERKAIKKDEEAKARQKELMDKLAQMQGKAIMSHDTTGIAEQQQDLKDTVMKNIDAINKGGAGAVEAELAVNQKIATLNQNINSSVEKRKGVEALAKDMQANPNRYTKKSRKNVEDFIINGGMVKNPDGTWAVNPYDETQLAEPSTDLQTELKATRDALRETSPKTKKGYTLPDGTYVESETYNTSLEDVKDDKGNIVQPGVHPTLRRLYVDNERVRNKAHELFEDESDDVKKQYTDPTTGEVDAAKYFADTFASQVGHTETSRTSKTPQGKGEGSGFGGINVKTRVNFVPQYDDSGSLKGGTMAYADPQNDPPVTHYDYGDKNKQVSVKPISFNIDKNIYEVAVMKTPAELKEIEKNKAINQERAENNAILKRDIDAASGDEDLQKYYLSKVKPLLKIEPEETIKKVSADYFNEVFGKKYGGSISEVQKRGEGGLPSNFYVTEGAKGKAAPSAGGMSATQWNQKWASLPKGQSLVGLDGKTYTKK